jgi:hypothetical protein
VKQAIEFANKNVQWVGMKPSMTPKPYWEMTTAELREATSEFEDDFVAETAKPLNAAMRSRWERAKSKTSRACKRKGYQTIAVRLKKGLLDQCTKLAKKKRSSRDALIARGLRALLAAESGQ